MKRLNRFFKSIKIDIEFSIDKTFKSSIDRWKETLDVDPDERFLLINGTGFSSDSDVECEDTVMFISSKYKIIVIFNKKYFSIIFTDDKSLSTGLNINVELIPEIIDIWDILPIHPDNILWLVIPKDIQKIKNKITFRISEEK